ncbi:MAG: hypothetical protein NTW03_16150, partial [Verrucomicrobia bacterium]|nr:hypothetical protein [Verrucomicrobiota bacterium]
PDDRFLDATTIPSLIKKDFEPVTGERMFGDLIVLLEDGQSATHMCVYVADEVVFTKNGVDPLEPWLLMKIKDMLPRYTNGHPLQVVTLRSPREKNSIILPAEAGIPYHTLVSAPVRPCKPPS